MAVSTPKYYGNSLRDLDQRYRIIISEFTETYPEAKTFPNMTEYTNSLQIDENNLNQVQGDLFQLNNKLEKDIKTLEITINRTNKKIAKVEKENKFLKKRLYGISGSKNAAIGMLDDIQLRYNQKLLGNVIFFIVLASAGTAFYKNRKK